jgi:two-component system CheB/CheR fusion protein
MSEEEEQVLQGRLADLSAALEAERERCRQAEAGLRDTEERYQLLVEGARDYGIVLLDRDGRIATWSEGARRLTGYEAEEVIGRPMTLLLTPEDRERGLAERELRSAEETGRYEDENWIIRRDSSRLWASGVSTCLRDEDGGLRGFVKIFRDLTERRQAQEALQEREYRLRVALAAARMGTWLWHIPRDSQTTDEGLQRLFGLPPQESVSNLEGFLERIHPQDRAAVAEAFQRSVREGASLNVEFRVVWPDGTVRWLRDQGAVFHDPQGQPLYLAGACVDLTERRELEEALRRAHNDLERRVEERTAQLRESQQRALQAERLATIGQTMAALTHESGNALQRAQTYLERLRWKLQDLPEALALLDEFQKAQDDLLHLYEDVRGYAAPINLSLSLCDLGKVWREAWAQLLDLYPGREALVREEAGGCDLVCTADAFRLGQVFRNLFDNALAASPDPVVVTVSCTDETLGGLAALRLAVRDNGPGLNPEQKQRMFEPFYTTKTRGTGLGLAIARRILEAHGGQIAVGEAPGPGAEMVFILPRRRV